MEELIAILQGLKPDVDFEKETNLVTGGILDSFDVVSLVMELNNTFDIEITASDMVFENSIQLLQFWRWWNVFRMNNSAKGICFCEKQIPLSDTIP